MKVDEARKRIAEICENCEHAETRELGGVMLAMLADVSDKTLQELLTENPVADPLDGSLLPVIRNPAIAEQKLGASTFAQARARLFNDPRIPPTPVGQADGRILQVADDALVYGDAAAATDSRFEAIYGTQNRLIIWDNCDNNVEEPTSIFGRQTSSGHTWIQGPAIGGGAHNYDYMPEGYLRGVHNANDGIENPIALIDHDIPDLKRIRMWWESRITSNWDRILIINFIDEDNILYARLSNDQVHLNTRVAGVNSFLGTLFSASAAFGWGAVGRRGLNFIDIQLYRCHASHSDIFRGVQCAVNLRHSQTSIGLQAGEEVLLGTGKVGIVTPRSTSFFGLAVWDGDDPA